MGKLTRDGLITHQVFMKFFKNLRYTEPATTCSKLTIETLEQGVNCVQN